MKTSIKLVLIYFGFQIIGAILGLAIGFAYSLIKFGNVDQAQSASLAPALLLGIIFMTIYLWKAGYISKEKTEWSIVTPLYMVMTTLIYFATTFLIDFLMSYMKWLPNVMENTFDTLQSGWLGILCIAVLGPILEELLFRGAITKTLLRKYQPTKAILLSALIFGVFHINPVQVVSAGLIGLLLAWIYYKTASLIPCILIHILNNSLSVFLSLKYPEVENTKELFAGDSTYYIYVLIALVAFVGLFLIMKKTTIPYPWKKNNTQEQILEQ